MHKVCVGMGFCGSIVDGKPRHVVDYIPNSGSVTADEFASWVLEAEGMPSEPGEPFWYGLRDVFVEHMGSETVDAQELVGGLYK